ncbi:MULTISPECIES: DUF2214 family protein [Flavobacteriaceae]|uniref:Mobilization protein n=1 Tax=Paenimyroides tangerinum TaxID=2488728 RepID=A0A3P3VXZ0_9FLAO|nr:MULTISPECIES: DUF2214 family protein [Flavobacteriaceae]RRJ87354.1 hypothetical protein EG240_15355 [Paenimyroides tangerinum]
MKIKYFEYIVMYLSVFLVCVLIGIAGRLILIEKGADAYTANVFFWISIGFGILLFAILSLFLNELVVRLLKFLFKNKATESATDQISEEGNLKLTDEKRDVVVEPEFVKENIPDINIKNIRKQQQNLIINQKQNKIETVTRYVHEQFALYTSDEDLMQLCNNVTIYVEQLDFENLKPIIVKDLSTLDLYHFGWNIWNYFKVSKQDKVAEFLKITFSESLKDVEVNSIKTHLKDDDQKGIIKINDDLSCF